MTDFDYRYPASVVRVIDADTLVFNLDLGLRSSRVETVRLYGLNAPEKNTPKGRDAKRFVEGMLSGVESVLVRTHRDQQEKYGRWLAEVVLASGAELGALLIEAGHAVPWDGKGKRP